MFDCFISKFILILNLAWFHCILQDALLSFPSSIIIALSELLSVSSSICALGFPGAEAQIPLLLHVSMTRLPPFSYCIQTDVMEGRELEVYVDLASN